MPCLTRGQENDMSQSVTGAFRYHYGFILDHHPEMAILSKSHISVFEVDLMKSTFGKKQWEKLYHYPNLGVGYIYSSLGGAEILGKLHGLYPFVDLPVINRTGYATVRLGLGLSYVTEIFNLDNNFRNTAISRHLNALIVLGLNAGVKINSDTKVEIGLSFIHFSNGGTRMPNYGVNLPTANATIIQRFSEKKMARRDYLDNPLSTRWVVRALISCGSKEIFPVNGPNYFVSSASLQGFYKIWKGGMIGLSFDLGYDASDMELLNRKDIYPDSKLSVLKPGLSLGYAILLGNLSLSLHAGTYLYEPEKSDGNIYDQLVLNYKIWKGLHANLTLKTHFAKADFVGLGLGYQIEFK